MSAPELPDFAMTAYCAGGTSALSELVANGLLEAGEYACPECEGTDEMVELGAKLWGKWCENCLGCGAIDIAADMATPGLR
jgi:hypothetical protein